MENIRDILIRGEDSKIQFKRRFDSVDSLAAEICAMANSEGGVIIVGVSDDGKAVGIDDLEKTNQWVSNACSQKIEPPVSVTTENVLFEGKRLLLIKVPLGADKPYAANKGDFWIKVGADKRRASRAELKILMQASGAFHADELPVVGAGLADLDRYEFERFCERNYDFDLDIDGLSIERLMENLKLFKDPCPTLAGLLLFGKHPERFRPQFVVKAVAFAGTDIGGDEYLDSEDIHGPMHVVFKNGLAFMKRNLRKVQKGRSFNTLGILEIPEVCLEEAYVNSLIHRDYFVDSSVRLFVFDDRVEIASPGSLPNSVTTENIKLGIQVVRNPILVSFAGRIGIPYRGIGSGIVRIIRECRKARLPEPEFADDKAGRLFKVTFRRP